MKKSAGIPVHSGRPADFFWLLVLFLGMTLLTAAPAHATDYVTIESGLWDFQDTWAGGIPSYNGALENGSRVFIDHDVTLKDQSFSSGAKKFELHIGKNSPATLIIDKDFTISSTITIIVYEGSSFVVGKAPSDPDYDYCSELATENVLFQVEGSEQDPSLKIQTNAKFILYGDLEVKNKFNIEVSPGGLFKVYGGFTAGNTATVSLSGTGAQIGCDMLFDNGAEIFMDVGTLQVGGDLLFGNTAYLTLIGSTINVGGSICSYPGGGSGATVYLVGTEEQPSTITSQYTCEDVYIEEVDGVTLPVKLLSFTFRVEPQQVILQWVTATEINNDFFTLERSADMQAWEPIAHMPGAGNSNRKLSYQFVDHVPQEGINYYRLKQTDLDGQYEYFKPLAVEFLSGKNQQDFKVIKTPGQCKVMVPAGETWQVAVHSLNGRLMHSGQADNIFHFPAPRQPVVVRAFNDTNHIISRVVM